MNCPICKGPVMLTDAVDTPTNEVLRRKKCFKCGFVFYSTETVVPAGSKAFTERWEFYTKVRPSHL